MINNLIHLTITIAPFFLLGLVISGLIKALIPEKTIKKNLAKKGITSIIKAAIFGMPLPLCSCGVIPVATEIKKQGASNGATTAFLIATPETGVDSISVSAVLLGPFMAVARPVSALFTAILTGIAIEKIATSPNGNVESKTIKSCCSTQGSNNSDHKCCSTPQASLKESCCSSNPIADNPSLLQKFINGQKYSFTNLYDDTFKWLALGIIAAAAITTFVPSEFLKEYSGSYIGMILIMLVSIPMYTCATSSTPIAAAMIAAGVSPGTAMIFLLTGPATNVATIGGMVKSHMGNTSAAIYVGGIAVSAFVTAIIVDYLITKYDFSITTINNTSEHLIPAAISWVSVLILFITQKNIRRLVKNR